MVIVQKPITFRGTEPNAIVFLCYKHCVSIMYYIAVDVTKKCLIKSRLNARIKEYGAGEGVFRKGQLKWFRIRISVNT